MSRQCSIHVLDLSVRHPCIKLSNHVLNCSLACKRSLATESVVVLAEASLLEALDEV
jgi:hypothetical protein